MHRHQRQLREGKPIRLYPLVGPVSNVITLKLFLDLGIWSSHRSRVGSWDVQVSRISNIEFTILDPPGSPREVCQKIALGEVP